MTTLDIVSEKIKMYNAKGSLGHTATLFMALYGINHNSTREHACRVALRAEATAYALVKDNRAAFFGGFLHDVGKITLPAELFDGHNISAEEYAQVKAHAIAGFQALKGQHAFTALCAGLHHNLYKAGYGLTVADFPKEWSPKTVKKVLEISTIISICDFVDAYIHRATICKDPVDREAMSLKDMLYAKYPDDHVVVDAALSYEERT